MLSRTTREFRRLLSGLPEDIQRDAKRAYRLFHNHPAHPGLQFKKLEGDELAVTPTTIAWSDSWRCAVNLRVEGMGPAESTRP